MKLWRTLTSRTNSGLGVEKGNKRTRIDEESRLGGRRRRGHRRGVVSRSGKKEDRTMDSGSPDRKKKTMALGWRSALRGKTNGIHERQRFSTTSGMQHPFCLVV